MWKCPNIPRDTGFGIRYRCPDSIIYLVQVALYFFRLAHYIFFNSFRCFAAEVVLIGILKAAPDLAYIRVLKPLDFSPRSQSIQSHFCPECDK